MASRWKVRHGLLNAHRNCCAPHVAGDCPKRECDGKERWEYCNKPFDEINRWVDESIYPGTYDTVWQHYFKQRWMMDGGVTAAAAKVAAALNASLEAASKEAAAAAAAVAAAASEMARMG